MNQLISNLTSLVKKRKKVGRGGSRGGTSGKGHKGQKARSGPSIGVIFEGGQMPLTRRLPKRGFNNDVFKKFFELVNLDRLTNIFDNGAVIDKQVLIEKGVIKKSSKLPVKILANGTLDKKFIVHTHAISKSAADAITNKGGEVHIIKES